MASEIVAFLDSVDGTVDTVGFEAGVMSQHLYYGLVDAGFKTVCMETRQVAAALSAMRNKTDKNDARGIAQVLRSGWYSPVHITHFLDHLKLEFSIYNPVWEKEYSMKKSKFTDAQIAYILRQAEEGTTIAEVCRKAGIAEATFYNWRKRYGSLKACC